jgi:hypothetical protein
MRVRNDNTPNLNNYFFSNTENSCSVSHLKWEKFWASHNSTLVFAFILAIFISFLFLYFAYSYNNYTNSLSQDYSIKVNSTSNTDDILIENANLPKYVSGDVYFEMPDIVIPSNTWDVKVTCKIYVENGVLSQNTPISNISINMYFGPTLWNTLDIGYIKVQAINLIDVYDKWDYDTGITFESLFPSQIYRWQGDDVGAQQFWSGFDWQEGFFQDSGPVALKINRISYVV